MTGKHAVGRVIARPFVGEYPNYTRTANRHDYSLAPPADTVADQLKKEGFQVISIGKTADIFCGRGFTESHPTKSNADGMSKLDLVLQKDFNGLCFANLVDFDSHYGHRNDIAGYAKAISQFDQWLKGFLPKLTEDDLLIITADHGCDPATPSTDHSREYVPYLAYRKNFSNGKNLGTKSGFFFVKEEILRHLTKNN